MIKAYYYKGFTLFALHNSIGIVLPALLYFLYNSIYSNIEISGYLNIIILFIAIIVFGIVSTNGFLIFISPVKIYIHQDGIKIQETGKDEIFFEWESISKIHLKSENINLLNMYIELNDGKELRFILKKNWLFSILTKYSLRSNLADLEKLMEDILQFKSKFNVDNLNEIKKYLDDKNILQ